MNKGLKEIKNPKWNEGAYGPLTTVGDIKRLLQDMPDDLILYIQHPDNPRGWIDIKSVELVARNPDNYIYYDYVKVTTSSHEK